MWFWWFILICDCLIPAIMIIAGRMMWKHCPKKINGVVGYRTKMSKMCIRDRDVKKSFDAGMNAHLSKPVDIKQMYAVLDELVTGDGLL